MRKACSVLALAGVLFGSASAHPDDHLVPRQTVDARLADAVRERAQNLATLDETLASAGAARAAAKVGLDVDQLRRALPLLSDAELRDLSRRTAALRSDPVAGYHSETYFLFVLVLVAAFALVLLEAAHY
jgi:hypothetical protein